MPNKRINIFLAVAILTLTALACNALLPLPTQDAAPTQERSPTQIMEPTVTQPQNNNLPQTEGEVPRVSVEVAKAAVDSGAAIIVDVRSPAAYEHNHVAGAISIPLGAIELDPTNLKLDKDQWIITYCT
jgi:3-mercaptopyruvate sulfurtransferase SseA